MLRARLVSGIFGVYFLLAPATARSQSARSPLSRRDSLRASSDAHAAQRYFERLRRHFLPTSAASDDAPCQTEVGRMCYWQDDTSELPVAEPRSIATARLALIDALKRLGTKSPDDDWIAGQHIRYMVEAGADSAAVSVAQACVPARWYCDVLRGYAFHASERYADASAAFDSALAQMPAAERCRWNDISVLLNDADRDSYSRIPCGQRDSLETRFWTLAQPSFAVAANDRRTEHFSRVLLADLSENAENTYGLDWGPDLRELLIRYGEPSWYTTTWPQPLTPAPTPLGHDRTPSFHFVADMTDGTARWDTHSHTARERYSPRYMDTVIDLDAQFAMMKRGDSALVVAAYADSAPTRAVLGVSGNMSDTAPDDLRRAHVRRARTEWKGMMVAMETFDPTSRRDAQTREWLAPPPHAPGAPELSTLLLFAADTSAAIETLDDALRYALTANELRGTRRLGLYWEVYGTSSSAPRTTDSLPVMADSQATNTEDSASVMVTVVRTDGGIMRWLGHALRITPHDSPLAVRWHDAQTVNGIVAHSVILDLSQLPNGTYNVTVAVGADDARRTSVSREIRLR